jgi:hypothetical protein
MRASRKEVEIELEEGRMQIAIELGVSVGHLLHFSLIFVLSTLI